MGSFKERMIGNEWASDLALIGKPEFDKEKPKARDTHWASIWIDDARGIAVSYGRRLPGKIIVDGVDVFKHLETALNMVKDEGFDLFFANQVKENDKIRGVPLIAFDPIKIAMFSHRNIDKIKLSEGLKELQTDFACWDWLSTGASAIDYIPGPTTPSVLSVAAAAYRLLGVTAPFEGTEE